MPTRASVDFLGIRFEVQSIEEAVRGILAEVPHRFKYIVTPNVHHMVRLLEDTDTIKPLFETAWRVFCDSRVLGRIARLFGLRLSVIPGSDLTARLLEQTAKQHLLVAIVGPTAPECATLASKYPGLKFVSHSPPMGFIKSEHEVQTCVDFVVAAHASITFLAVGMPQQEMLARRIADDPRALGVGLCIGASIDFLTGKQKRAPIWIQKAGFEWLYRLLSDPRRLARRYLIDCPRFFLLLKRSR
jgi:N-acetylglucosaminyldiphosphoundecaprenol N-acetyl-beta-D-mannosaminyltransferase